MRFLLLEKVIFLLGVVTNLKSGIGDEKYT